MRAVWPDAILAGFGVVVFIIGAALYWAQSRQRARTAESQSWPVAAGTIAKSSVEKWSSKKRTAHAALVRYSYRVGTRDYQSNRVFWGLNEGPEKEMNALAAAYPVGSAVQVHYDPQHPATAVLQPERNTGLKALSLYGATLMLLGIVGLGSGLFALLLKP